MVEEERLKNLPIVLDTFPNIKLECKPKDNLMPERGTLSINKAKNLINEPQFPIEVKKYIDWYKKFASNKQTLF